MNYDLARRYAEELVANLAGWCARIEIAGSIRRRRQDIGDIDLVLMPWDVETVKLCCRESCEVLADGNQNFRFVTPAKVQVDLYFASPGEADLFGAQPSNWGSVLLCRTGSANHNIYIAQMAKTRGLKWNTSAGLLDQDGNLVASETEESIFDALGLPFVPPEKRER